MMAAYSGMSEWFGRVIADVPLDLQSFCASNVLCACLLLTSVVSSFGLFHIPGRHLPELPHVPCLRGIVVKSWPSRLSCCSVLLWKIHHVLPEFFLSYTVWLHLWS